ncbi:MAG TPA: 2TM domain-containing protein [Longimicrobium sp.]|nr:2TM domain-containing protein [Longimicrobium sp.]
MQDTLSPAEEPAGAQDPEAARIRRRVHQKADLFRHLVAFVVVGAAVAGLDLLTSPGTTWFIWPMGVWAIGLVLHAADVYVMGADAGMEERMVEREMERHRHAHG